VFFNAVLSFVDVHDDRNVLGDGGEMVERRVA